jgi:hypothetical protein
MNTFEHLETAAQASGWPMGRIVAANPLEEHYLVNSLLRDNAAARTSYHILAAALRRGLCHRFSAKPAPEERQAAA